MADTALWMAHIRAVESRRADAAFADPLAALLCGSRGARIARSMPRAGVTAWGVVIRTSGIDRLLETLMSQDIDTVLNLGAGMDTRPYRLRLPPALCWIEVDLPGLLEAKAALLAGHAPVCTVQRIGLDLEDRQRRRQLFAQVGATARRILVICEGLIPYFSVEEAAELAADLGAMPSVQYWLQDFDNAGPRAAMPKRWAKIFAAAPLIFNVADWFDFFERAGWRIHNVLSTADEAEQLRRAFPLTLPLGLLMRLLPGSMRRRILATTGAVVLEKAAPRAASDEA